MFRIYCLLIGYAFGLIQNAYIIGRLVGKIDIREHGSKSAGSTNINRVLGSKAAGAVFAMDIFKGIAAFMFCSLLFGGSSSFTTGINSYIPGLYAGIGVVLGHDFPFYIGFKGGKGIASTVGILFCFDIRIALICYAVTLAVICLSKYISLGSLTLAALFPVLTYFIFGNAELVLLALAIAAIAYYQHKENITRLIMKEESKFKFKKGRDSV